MSVSLGDKALCKDQAGCSIFDFRMDPLGPRPAYASFCSSIPADNPFERGEARDRPDGARALAAGGAAGAFSLFQQPPLEPFAPRAAEPSGPEPSEAPSEAPSEPAPARDPSDQEAARLPAPVQSAAAAPRGSTVTQGTPGDIATKHPHETYGEFYARRDRGLTYEECGVVGSTQGRGGAQAGARRARDAAASAAASAAYVALIGFANGGRDARTITVRGTRGRGRTVTNKGGPDGDPRYGQLWCVFARPFPRPPPTPTPL